jgi:hypothetical protein
VFCILYRRLRMAGTGRKCNHWRKIVLIFRENQSSKSVSEKECRKKGVKPTREKVLGI